MTRQECQEDCHRPIRAARAGDREEWLRMRLALWPDWPAGRHLREMEGCLAGGLSSAAFVLVRTKGLGGFVEAAVHPYEEDCETRPVGYLEALYVDPDLRRKGVARRLVARAEAWARERGCEEMASDAEIPNEVGIRAHKAMGYEETSRVVKFRKTL